MKSPRILYCAAGAVLLLGAAANSYADYASEMVALKPLTYWRFNDNVSVPVSDTATNLGSLGPTGNGLYYDAVTRSVPGAIAGDTAVAFSNPTLGTGYVGAMGVLNNPALNPSGPFTIEFWAKSSNNTASLLSPVNSISSPRGELATYSTRTQPPGNSASA